jgi:DNA-binding beta-propeller fold protein YncE
MQETSIIKNSVKIVLCIFLLLVLVQSALAAETYVFVIKWGQEGSGDGQFINPFGVATDSSGNVYVADTYNHRIQKFSSNGVFLTKWVQKDQVMVSSSVLNGSQ